MKCINCNQELVAEHSFCPNCGYDLRNSKYSDQKIPPSKEKKTKKTILNRISSPSGSIWISFLIGTMIMEMKNELHKYFYSEEDNLPGVLGQIVGAGLGFLIIAIIPSLTISLIIYAIKKKFPRNEFSLMVYVFTLLESYLFLSTLN